MNRYTPDNLPKRGTAKKIWARLHKAGFKVKELHYNPNCWNKSLHGNGWATWAFTEIEPSWNQREGWFVGIDENGLWVKGLEIMNPRRYIVETD